jgi:hypothetical protein
VVILWVWAESSRSESLSVEFEAVVGLVSPLFEIFAPD